MIHAVKFVTALMIPVRSLRFVSSIYHFMTPGVRFPCNINGTIPEVVINAEDKPHTASVRFVSSIWFVSGIYDTNINV